MEILKKKRYIFTDLKFALFLLGIIAIISSIGSFLEQDEPISFYEENYKDAIYGFINSSLIINLGLDHVYRTWWFLFLLILLGICLISCTITRQFPLFLISKDYLFKTQKKSFLNFPFFIKLKNIFYLKETSLLKLQKLNFYIFQRKNFVYGYKGLIGRISPILVHFSLILILLGSSIGAFENFKAQEMVGKGEVFHIQNVIRVGWITKFPNLNIRVNDFWVEYEKNKIHQFYSNLSILDNFGNEIKTQTISVNNPLRYKFSFLNEFVDFYQSDWNLVGIRVKKENKILEYPLFSLKENSKSWITWIKDEKNTFTLIFDQFENTFLIYDEDGKFLLRKNVGDFLNENLKILEILPSTGLLIKYDPSIQIIYLGFGILMVTTSLSYFPYIQLWMFSSKKNSWIGGSTNRGKIQLEIQFENFLRFLEKIIEKNNSF